MFNKLRLKEALVEYKKRFVQTQWPEEKYKWEAVKCFQLNWNIHSNDFTNMLKQALSQTGNLLASQNHFPLKMIEHFAEIAQEEVRAMFIELFDESKDIYARIDCFKRKSDSLLEEYGDNVKQHYQDENAICTYLWLRYPDIYYIYKFSEIQAVSQQLESNYTFKRGDYEDNIRHFLSLYNEICAELQKDDELKKLLASHITENCYPDSELRTLTFDVGFFISRYFNKDTNTPSDDESERRYWFLNAAPEIWDMSDISIGGTVSYTLLNDNGNKRRIYKNFLNAKVGDKVIGYVSAIQQIVAILQVSAEQDGEEIYFETSEVLSSPIDLASFRECPELNTMEFFTNIRGSLFKLTQDEYEVILNIIREKNPAPSTNRNDAYNKVDFLRDVYMKETDYDRLAAVLKKKKNIILQGAPGVGKTFTAKRLAYSIMGEMDDKRIKFVQFHQNYSYEDFVMGYKPVNDGFKLKYGVFYQFCKEAEQHPDKDYFFIIDEINRGNMSKIFGELLMLIEADYRDKKLTLAYEEEDDPGFSVPKNLHIIGMMNTADRSLAMIDYALRRRFSFFNMKPGFESDGFIKYQKGLANDTFNTLIECIKDLNETIKKELGEGFCIGHSYFCNTVECTEEWMKDVVDFDILPVLSEYWFDDEKTLDEWEKELKGVFQ